jgi:hypothetical protein
MSTGAQSETTTRRPESRITPGRPPHCRVPLAVATSVAWLKRSRVASVAISAAVRGAGAGGAVVGTTVLVAGTAVVVVVVDVVVVVVVVDVVAATVTVGTLADLVTTFVHTRLPFTVRQVTLVAAPVRNAGSVVSTRIRKGDKPPHQGCIAVGTHPVARFRRPTTAP